MQLALHMSNEMLALLSLSKTTRLCDAVENTCRSSWLHGVSGYMGFDGVLLYLKYDLNPIFKDAEVKQNNISLGLRFDI